MSIRGGSRAARPCQGVRGHRRLPALTLLGRCAVRPVNVYGRLTEPLSAGNKCTFL